MNVATDTLRKQLVPISDELTATPLNFWNYQAELVLFPSCQGQDEKWMTHSDAEVITYVSESQGRWPLRTLREGPASLPLANWLHEFYPVTAGSLFSLFCSAMSESEK